MIRPANIVDVCHYASAPADRLQVHAFGILAVVTDRDGRLVCVAVMHDQIASNSMVEWAGSDF